MTVCEWCPTEGIVRVNDHWACTDHIDQAMSAVMEPVRQFLAATDPLYTDTPGVAPTHHPDPARAVQPTTGGLPARLARVPTHQRVLVLSFETAEQAEAWDQATNTEVLTLINNTLTTIRKDNP